MGANCQCAGPKAEEVFKQTPRQPEDYVDVADKGKKVPVPPEFQKLQGTWRTDGESQLMGEIIGATIVWDKVFNLSQSKLRLAADGSFEMTLNGAVHKAKYEPGADRMVWSDGEVWVRAK